MCCRIKLLSNELTEPVVPCLETTAWYLAIFSFMDVNSNTDMDGATAVKSVTPITHN